MAANGETDPEGREAVLPSTAGRTVRWGKGVRSLVQVILTVLVTWVIVRQVGVTLDEALSLEPALPDVRPIQVTGSVLLLAACFAFTARLWGWMVRDLGGPDPGWVGSNRIVLTANLGRYLPGKIWQVAGLAALSRREGIGGTLGTCAGVLTQAFHLVGAAVLGGAVISGMDGGREGLRMALVALVLFVVLASVPAVMRAGLGLAFRMAGLGAEQLPRTTPTFGIRWLCLHTLAWLGYGIAFALLVRGLGLQEAILPLAAAFSAAYLVGYLAIFAPAGLGVREGVLIALLRPSMGAAAVGVAVLSRVWMTAVELVPAGGFALWSIFRRKEKSVPEPEGPIDG